LLKLPREVWSQLGAIPVQHVAGMIDHANKEEAAYGRCNFVRRSISVDPSACEATQFATLFHEMVHLALWDAGVKFVSEDHEETVCDAIGSYLAGAMIAGYVKLAVPRE
jgi:hypothetical protein